MTDTQPTIRCTDRNDLLAVPTMLLGFHPAESLVMMHLIGKEVEFVSRVDAVALLKVPDTLMAQLRAAGAPPERSDGRWIFLLYAESPERYVDALVTMAGDVANLEHVFVADATRSWELLPGGLCDVQLHDPATSSVAAETVFQGQPWARTRDDVVASLGRWSPNPAWVEDARELVWGLHPDDRLELLRTLVETGVPQGRDSALVASLLGEEECFAEMLAQMSVTVADERRHLLVAAREQAPPEAVANVTALLALACWLGGEGALTSECLLDLDQLDPTHPMGDLIRTMQHMAIPPSRWDET
ncbi:MAG: DUF4192 family protein [Propionibacterium sp.]|nr:DUF4192 family protein [Propionibacterium sp.]